MRVEGFYLLCSPRLYALPRHGGLSEHGSIGWQHDVDAHGIAWGHQRALAGLIANHGVLHHDSVAALESERIASLQIAGCSDGRTGNAHVGQFDGRTILIAHHAEHTATLCQGRGDGEEEKYK